MIPVSAYFTIFSSTALRCASDSDYNFKSCVSFCLFQQIVLYILFPSYFRAYIPHVSFVAVWEENIKKALNTLTRLERGKYRFSWALDVRRQLFTSL